MQDVDFDKVKNYNTRQAQEFLNRAAEEDKKRALANATGASAIEILDDPITTTTSTQASMAARIAQEAMAKWGASGPSSPAPTQTPHHSQSRKKTAKSN